MKSNEWLINEEFLNTIQFENFDEFKFKKICKRFYTTIACLPIPITSSWDREHKMFRFFLGENFLKVPLKENVNEYDMCEILIAWCSKFFPSFYYEKNEEKEYTVEEIAEMIQKGENPDEVFNKKKIVKIKKKFTIEKIAIKDDQFTVDINGKKYILITKPQIPISVFLQTIRNLEEDEDKKAYLEQSTKSLLEVTFLKTIEIKYTGEELINFFKIRVPRLCDESLNKVEECVYKWGRFLIYFSNPEQISILQNIIKNFKNEYKSIQNIDNYLRKELGCFIGKKEDKQYAKMGTS